MSKTRDAREFARLLASDPVFQSKVKRRCLDELDGKYGNQIPCTEMIVSLATEDTAAPAGEFRVTFIARIIGQADELARPLPITVEALPAVDAIVVAGPECSGRAVSAVDCPREG